MLQTLSTSVHWFLNYDNVKSLTSKSIILTNHQVMFASHSPYWRVACFKHIPMPHTLFCVCNKHIFSDVEKSGEIDSVEKPTLIYGIPFGKVAVPKKWTSSNVTHFWREGHIIYVLREDLKNWKGSGRVEPQEADGSRFDWQMVAGR